MDLTAGLVPNLVLAVGTAAVVAVIGYFTLKVGNSRRLESVAGLQALCALKWRDFAKLLLQMFRKRGFVSAENERKPSDRGFDMLLTRGSARYLVQAKHGAAYRVNAADVDHFLSVMRTHGAEGGIIVTTGHFEPNANQAASGQNLELLDGEELWQELQPFLPQHVIGETRAGASHARAAMLRRLAANVVVVGVLAFAAAWLLSQPLPVFRRDVVPPPVLAEAVAPTPAPPPADTGPPIIIPPLASVPTPAPELSEEEHETRRSIAAEGVRAIIGVDSVAWSTKSTLAVGFRGGSVERRKEIVAQVCGKLDAFEEMQFTRVQLEDFEAKTKADARVHWHRCK